MSTGEITIAGEGLLARIEGLVARVERLEARLEQPPQVGWYGVPEAARYLSTTPGAVRAAERAGQLESYRSGSGRVMLSQDQLDRHAMKRGRR
jgi:hypothetical protein